MLLKSYLIHNLTASQARPNTPASSTASSANKGASATTVGLSPEVTFRLPMAWPFVKGATSGSGRATMVFSFDALPAGTATTCIGLA